ncbi:hypothetical protein GWI33_014254 [Rhynchophorus ferrugineus]|uniref:Uncharacterized protein n=1 Tax=Rhynchophorus ferrugineus TaxID=354439 RepID=A0A834I6I3_RHYFE|nr:hypothetical protein GWI33_014254 [Rhynchophorus ferrugineus]
MVEEPPKDYFSQCLAVEPAKAGGWAAEGDGDGDSGGPGERRQSARDETKSKEIFRSVAGRFDRKRRRGSLLIKSKSKSEKFTLTTCNESRLTMCREKIKLSTALESRHEPGGVGRHGCLRSHGHLIGRECFMTNGLWSFRRLAEAEEHYHDSKAERHLVTTHVSL